MSLLLTPRGVSDEFLYEWQYGAEGCICNAITEHDGGEGIHRNLGGWIQQHSQGGGTQQDEIFAIIPIHKDAASYAPDRYSFKYGSTTEKVDYLVMRDFDTGSGVGYFIWTMPGGRPLQVWHPIGEVLTDLAPSKGEMLVKWRDINWVRGDVYQWAYYVLSNDMLKIRWGTLTDSIQHSNVQPIQSSESCNDIDLICYVQGK